MEEAADLLGALFSLEPEPELKLLLLLLAGPSRVEAAVKGGSADSLDHSVQGSAEIRSFKSITSKILPGGRSGL